MSGRVKIPPAPLGGGSSDVAAFESWLASDTGAGDVILFGAGYTYLQTGMLRFKPDRTYAWPPGESPSTVWKVKDGTAMPATSGMWVPEVWDSNSSVGQLPVEFIHPCLDGNKANTTGGHHGLIMGGSYWWRVWSPQIQNARKTGLFLTNIAKDGTTVLGDDAADGIVHLPNIFNNTEHGIQQEVVTGANANMDVQVIQGRIWANGKSGITGRALAGWNIDGTFFFGNGEFNIESWDGWLDLSIQNCRMDSFANGQTTGTWAAVHLKGYQGPGFQLLGNKFWNNFGGTPLAEGGSAEPTGPTLRYIWIEAYPGAGNTAQGNCAENTIKGGNRAGVVGILKHTDTGTFYLGGKGRNLIHAVATPESITGAGTLTETGAKFV